MSLEALRHRPRQPRPWRSIACEICGRGILSQNDRETHKTCMGKPMLCDCGQPSIPFPLCTHCKGSGRSEGDLRKGEVCYLCPLGPCVGCAWKAMSDRIREMRDAGSCMYR